MLQRLKQAVARVEVDGKPNGTAFLIDPEHVVTANHVLLGRDTVTLRFAEWSARPPVGQVLKNKREAQEEHGIRTANVLWRPKANNADLAVLKLSRPSPSNVTALPLGDLPEVDAEWWTFGYPRGVPGGHRLAGGAVRDPEKLVEALTHRLLQLESSAAREWLSGYSGGPCVVGGLVVGVLTNQLIRAAGDVDPSRPVSTAGPAFPSETTRLPSLDTLYALPVDLLREWRPKIHFVRRLASNAAFFVPFARPNLLGRDPQLSRVHEFLSRRDDTGPAPALVGPGGVGKTQLAVLYAHTYANEYPGGVFWLDASQGPESIVAQIGSYALRTRLAAPQPSVNGSDYYTQLAALWLGRFGSRRDVLLVVDDVVDSSILVQQFGGATMWTFCSLTATVLATSRRSGIVGATDLDVQTLSNQDSEALLRRDAGRSDSNWDGAAAGEIVTALGNLPLAIRLAGGYLKRHRTLSIRDLATALERTGIDESLGDVIALEDYPATLRHRIAAVLAATLDDPSDAAASRLLSVLACLPSGQPIHVQTLVTLVDGRQELGADAAGSIDAPLDALRSANILDAVQGEELRLHGVIHAVRRAQLTHRFRRRVSGRLVGRLLDPRFLARQSGSSLLSIYRDFATLERMLEGDPLSAQVAAIHRVLGRTAHLLKGPASPLAVLHRQSVLMRETALARILDRAASAYGEPWFRLRWSTRRTDRAELRVLADASVEPRACSISADGELLAVGDRDGGVTVYQPRTGVRSMATRGHAGAVLCVAMCASGEVVASGGTDRAVRIWNVRSGDVRLAFQGHEHTVLGVALDRQGALAVSCGMDHSVRSWATEDGTCLAIWMHDRPVRSCAVSDDGRVALAGTDDGVLRVFDPRTGEELQRERPETCHLGQATLSPDGRFVLSGWANGALHLWDLVAGSRIRLQAPFTRNGCAISCCALSKDGSIAIAGSVDRTIRAWKIGERKQFAIISGLVRAAMSCALARDGDVITAAAGDLRVWNLLAAEESAVPPVHHGSIALSSISGDGRTGLTCGSDTAARVWDLASGVSMYELPVGDRDDLPTACAISRSGRTAVTSARGPGNGFFVVIHVSSPAGERRIARDVCFRDDNDLTRVWSTRTGKRLRTLAGAHEDWVSAVAISRDDGLVVTVSRNCRPVLWDLRNGDHRAVVPTDDASVGGCCSLAEDGAVLLVGGKDGRLTAWDTRTDDVLRVLGGHEAGVIACSLSISGEVAASISTDGVIRIWDVRTGQCTLELLRPGRLGCALTEDGALLLLYGAGVVSIYRAATGDVVVELPIEDVTTCSVNDDGSVLLVGDAAGHVSVFDRLMPQPQGILSKPLRALASLLMG